MEKRYTRYQLNEWDLKIFEFISDKEPKPQDILLFRFPEIKKQLKKGRTIEEILKNKSQYLHRKNSGNLWRLKTLGLVKKDSKDRSRFGIYKVNLPGIAKLWRIIQMNNFAEDIYYHKQCWPEPNFLIKEEKNIIKIIKPIREIKNVKKFNKSEIYETFEKLEKNRLFQFHLYRFLTNNIMLGEQLDLEKLFGERYTGLIRDARVKPYIMASSMVVLKKISKRKKLNNMENELKEYLELVRKYVEFMLDETVPPRYTQSFKSSFP